MNPASSSPQTSSVPAAVTAELIALPARGRWLRFLTSAAALLTACLAAAAFTDQLPPQYAHIGAFVTIVLLGLKEFVISVGDLLDDGVRNHSFSVSPRLPVSPSSRLPQWLLIPLAAFLCVGCVSEKSTDAEIRQAQLALSGAKLTLVVAQSQLAATLADPKAAAWKVQAATLALNKAQEAVEAESQRLTQITQARQPAVAVPAK